MVVSPGVARCRYTSTARTIVKASNGAGWTVEGRQTGSNNDILGW